MLTLVVWANSQFDVWKFVLFPFLVTQKVASLDAYQVQYAISLYIIRASAFWGYKNEAGICFPVTPQHWDHRAVAKE